MVCSALDNSFVYASFVQGHFVHQQVHLYSSSIVVKMQLDFNFNHFIISLVLATLPYDKGN